MHKGTLSPFNLEARVYMGPFTYPGWLRKEYDLVQGGAGFWQFVGPDPITNPPPYVCARETAFEGSPYELSLAAYVQLLAGQELWVGWHATWKMDGTLLRQSDQVWLGGVQQMDEVANAYDNSNLYEWNTNGHPHIMLPGATIGCFGLHFKGKPY